MRRAAVTVLSLGALVALSVPFAARDASSATMPTFSSLPAFHVIGPPGHADLPAHIAKKEKIDGVFLAAPPKEEAKQMATSGFKMVNVFLSEQQRQASENRGMSTPELIDACATTDRNFGEDLKEWPPMFESELRVEVQHRRPGDTNSRDFGGVTPVHVERLVTHEGSAELQITDLLVDPDTMGSKLVRTSKMPLVRLATGPFGADVYAARDESIVHFIVRAPRAPDKLKDDRSISFTARRLIAQLPSQFGSGQSDCGFLRASIHIDGGNGEMATVQATALFAPPDTDGSDKTGSNDGMPPGMDQLRETKSRPFVINLSASQTSADKEPLVSVSYAWATKEAQAMFH